ncbi:BURP domain-containing protein 6-like [Lotus japonicus]|uniref:BURP domain-containing protein 6-like n=1 Tax=Lotus japonicus TaxID=34305 RepID=UPI002586063A|nr:BURP domain-containing protein 6-like [Lotus japonicus]
MEFPHLGFLSAFFCLALVGYHVQASLPAEDYWKSLWPNTPMPKALKDLTQSDSEWKAGGRIHAKVGHRLMDLEVYSKPDKKVTSHPTKFKSHDEFNHSVTFFFEHFLQPGKPLNMEFTKRSAEFTFLPDKVAKSIPFSSNRISEILNHFNIEAKSSDAETLEHTIDTCELPAIGGVDKYCATSLESLVNFTVSKLGKNIRLVSSTVLLEKETQKKKPQQYSVLPGVKKLGDKAVACHKMNYLYAVFYCHKVATRSYSVPLVASDGTKAKALAVCHTDTAQWSNDNIALKQLKIKPGTLPVCHFIAADSLLWIPN